jgi:UDP-N-acetylmuramyl pentapeptide synthase
VAGYLAAAGAGAAARHFERVEALVDALASAPAARSALVKGSRFMRMERVVTALGGHVAGGH